MNPRHRLEIQIAGVVQGVGFRPWIVRLAAEHQLRGWVGNSRQGVEVVLEGNRPALEDCLRELQCRPPAQARIDGLTTLWGAAQGLADRFVIAPPSSHGATTAVVTPDLATCSACLAELQDPTNRRHGYPLISCTDCGPRYSVVRQLPFERQHTSLAAFPPCSRCQGEYDDPANRRFHAQTIGCPACGPQLLWQGHQAGSAGAIADAAAALQRGEIVAVQGMGGFQLLVDASQAEAVAELRRRKGRPEKPLALMAPRTWIQQHCHLRAAEAALLDGPSAPILLLHRRSAAAIHQPPQSPVASEVAGSSPWLGVMRPTTALHQLLLEAFGGVVVATSANRSGEPISTDHNQLRELADGVLRHGLEIINPIDDAVMRVCCGKRLVLRLGRGLAPVALTIPKAQAPGSGGLALGAQQKGSLAISLNPQGDRQLVQLSPDLGDLGSSAGEHHLRRTLDQWLTRHGLEPQAVVCDGHDAYVSTQLAKQWVNGDSHGTTKPDPMILKRVQHHHAHLLACMAEHHLEGPAVGLAFDGAGLGDDGSLWGGECLKVSRGGYQRLAHLRPFRLPGGDVALREPRRAAIGLLVEAFGQDWRSRLPAPPWEASGSVGLAAAFTAQETALLEQALQQKLNSPSCSSMGRLFDAAASLLGLWQTCSYEGQAAMALEALALEGIAREGLALDRLDWEGLDWERLAQPYRIALERGEPNALGDPKPWQLNWQPMLERMLDDQAAGVPASSIALAFHLAIAAVVAALADALKLQQVLLAGGCFQNQLLLEACIHALKGHGIDALWPQTLPCNDAAIAVGQLMALSI